MSGTRQGGAATASWYQQVRFIVLVELSPIARNGRRVRRGVLGAMVVLALVFGVWGWSIYAGQRPDAGYGVWEIVLASIGMFTVAGDVEPIPWQLDVGRILGGLATVGIVTEFAVEALAKSILARAAARATDHLLVLGPADRARPYLAVAADRERYRPAILLDPDAEADTDEPGAPDGLPGRVLALPVDIDGDRWPEQGNAAQAARIVLATGDDDHNLAALVDVLGATTAPNVLVTLEIDDPSRALEVAVALTADLDADLDIEVACPHQGRGACAVDQLLEQVGDDLVSGERPCVVIGDGPRSRAAGEHLRHRLIEAARGTATATPRLHVVDPDAEALEDLEARISPDDAMRAEVTHSTTLGGEDWPAAQGPAPVYLIDFADPAATSPRQLALAEHLPTTARTAGAPSLAAQALALVCERPDATAFVVREVTARALAHEDGPVAPRPRAGSARTTVVPVADADQAGYGRGPFMGIAVAQHVGRPRTSQPAPAADGDQGERQGGVELRRAAVADDEAELREQARKVRRAVRAILESGCRIRPTDPGSTTAGRPSTLFSDQALAQAVGGILGRTDGHTLIDDLRDQHLALWNPPTEGPR